MKRAAIEKATDDNHPLRKAEGFDEAVFDEGTLKRLCGLC